MILRRPALVPMFVGLSRRLLASGERAGVWYFEMDRRDWILFGMATICTVFALIRQQRLAWRIFWNGLGVFAFILFLQLLNSRFGQHIWIPPKLLTLAELIAGAGLLGLTVKYLRRAFGKK
jgi:hypothetical protein